MSGTKIIEGLKDAVARNFARVHIDGQTWVRQEWQPIETAPKDGTEILLFTHHEADEYLDESFDAVQIGWWDDGNHAPGSAFHRDAGWHQQKIGVATHWMPFPSPPREGGR